MFIHVHKNLKPTQSQAGGLGMVTTDAQSGVQVRIYGPEGNQALRLVFLTKLAKDLQEMAPNGGYVEIDGDIAMTARQFKGQNGTGRPFIAAWGVSAVRLATPDEANAFRGQQDDLRQAHLSSIATQAETVVIDTSNYRVGGRLGRAAASTVSLSDSLEAEVGLPQ